MGFKRSVHIDIKNRTGSKLYEERHVERKGDRSARSVSINSIAGRGIHEKSFQKTINKTIDFECPVRKMCIKICYAIKTLILNTALLFSAPIHIAKIEDHFKSSKIKYFLTEILELS